MEKLGPFRCALAGALWPFRCAVPVEDAWATRSRITEAVARCTGTSLVW